MDEAESGDEILNLLSLLGTRWKRKLVLVECPVVKATWQGANQVKFLAAPYVQFRRQRMTIKEARKKLIGKKIIDIFARGDVVFMMAEDIKIKIDAEDYSRFGLWINNNMVTGDDDK